MSYQICDNCKGRDYILYGSQWRCVCGHLNTLSKTKEIEMNKWKPITNAPMEENILLFHKDHGIHIGCRRKANVLDPYCIYQNIPNTRRYPTLWMPLPTPPEKEVIRPIDEDSIRPITEGSGPPPQKMVENPNCGSCRWFVRNFSRDSDHNRGVCYCNPNQLLSGVQVMIYI